MTKSQERFKVELIGSLSHPERFEYYFDFGKRAYLPGRVEAAKEHLSDGELQVLYFLLNVWRGEAQFPFDFFYAASKLDENNKQLIANWFQEPFWP